MRRTWARAGARRHLAAALAAIAALAAGALATTVEALSLPQLVARAERIVEARVVGVAPTTDGQGRPATQVGLVVLSTLKGAPSGLVEVVLPGGSAGGRTLAIAGIPRLEPGEEVVLFLSGKSSAGLTLPIGLGQGTYRARVDAKTGTQVVAPDLAGLELRDPKTGAPVAAAAAPVARAAFLAEVRRLVGAK
ncbi:MAG TPA: hypothetical protein VKE69_10610 [Planctomycetota bacterium]|nr:hypothetical protein [Planctomycetota bacterium]